MREGRVGGQQQLQEGSRPSLPARVSALAARVALVVEGEEHKLQQVGRHGGGICDLCPARRLQVLHRSEKGSAEVAQSRRSDVDVPGQQTLPQQEGRQHLQQESQLLPLDRQRVAQVHLFVHTINKNGKNAESNRTHRAQLQAATG